jgi:AsmA-like protein
MSVVRDGATRRKKLKQWLLLSVIVFFVAAIFLPPLVNIGRYQRRIANSISASIGRPIHLSQVQLRLLPRPGFEISDFRIEDDPAFSNEPLLRAPSVVAYIRLLPLWRGQLVVDRISLDEANLNFVRLADGRWNFGSLLLKASQAAATPTAERRTTTKPHFPYISASNARINFKSGVVKLPFSFLNADLSAWLEQPDEWRMRFEAQPVRTDMDLDLADMGTVRLEGSFHRASKLELVPFEVRGAWNKAQIGQLTRLLLGRDTGWRGNMSLETTITGTAEHTHIATRLKGDSLHRTEFEPVSPLDFDATCTAQYFHEERTLKEIACNSPVGKGQLHLTGKVEGLWDQLQPSTHLKMKAVPTEAVLDVLRTTRSDFAPDIKVAGAISGELDYAAPTEPGSGVLMGSLSAEGVQLSEGKLKAPVTLPTLSFTAFPPAPNRAVQPTSTLYLTPFSVDTGEEHPLKLGAQFTRTGFSLQLSGPAKIDKLMEFSQAFGLSKAALSQSIQGGTADLALTIRGPWVAPMSNIDRPAAIDRLDGSVSLKGSHFTAGFLANPLVITQAKAIFDGNRVSWQQAEIEYGSLHATADLQYNFPCSAQICAPDFRLHFTSLDTKTLQAVLLGAKPRGTLLNELLSRFEGNHAPWPRMEGTVETPLLTVDRLSLHDAYAEIAIDTDTVSVKSLDARALGGNLHLIGDIATNGEKPQYSVEANLTHANPAELGEIFHQKWGTGQVDLTTKLTLTGFTEKELVSSAAGNCHWEWTRGGFPTEGPGTVLTRFDRWTAKSSVSKGTLTIDQSQTIRGRQIQAVTGTILLAGPPKFSITPAKD